MIKVEELMRGNIVDYNGEYFSVEVISSQIIVANREYGNVEFKPSELNPVVLSDEILLKCGFKFSDGFYNITDEIRIDSDNYNIYAEPNNNIMLWIGVERKYLHQLQNLYYSLTGKPLTFKP